jgi:hypothetical protein
LCYHSASFNVVYFYWLLVCVSSLGLRMGGGLFWTR